MRDEGQRRSPLLRGPISAGPTLPEEDPPPPQMEVVYQDPLEPEFDPSPPPRQPQTPVRLDGPVEGAPCRPQLPTLAVLDIEMLTPTPGLKHHRIWFPDPPPPYTPILFAFQPSPPPDARHDMSQG